MRSIIPKARTYLARSARWPLSLLAETATSACVSAASYRSREDIGIVAVIVAELEFGDVERQILFADLMERPDHATLDERPETVDRLSVNCADDVLFFGVVDGFVRIVIFQAPVALPFIAANQADLGRNGLIDERRERVGFGVVDNARDDV